MPRRAQPLEDAARLMAGFAERTGLASDRPPQRYLWTDAFAVCNLLSLAGATSEPSYANLALRLVDQVHHVLGRHRADDPRTGWLSGLPNSDGEAHPTRGGLRIGKRLAERERDEPVDERLEWERDGQYFHYLTKWMHALDQVSRFTREPRFNLWARELAVAAHAGFVVRSPGSGSASMIWKASIDLSRPLVASMGQHDALDGLVTCAQLKATAADLPGAPSEPSLDGALADFAAMLEGRSLMTTDPLGLGGLLMDAGRLAQLARRGAFAGDVLTLSLLAAAAVGITYYARQGELEQAAARRLAFRELGLAIGLHAVELIQTEDARLEGALQQLRPHLALASAIESFWLEPSHRAGAAWSDHRDINDVMLATSLLPAGALMIT